jgi:putative heme-binding domain-containing protein
VTALQSPNRETQFLAWKKLQSLGKGAQPDLEKLFRSDNPRMRARALSLLSRIPGNENHALEAGLTDPHAGVVTLAIRLATTFSATHELDTSVLEARPGLVPKLLRHPDPQVRRQIAISLHGGKQIESLWAELALQHDGKDRWYLEALGIGAAGHEDVCYDAWIKRGGSPRSPAGRDIVWRLRSSRCAEHLAAIVEDAAIPEGEKNRLMRAFDFLPSSAEKQASLIQVATGSKAPVPLARHALFQLQGSDAVNTPAVRAVIERLLDKSAGTPEFVQLAAAFGLGNRSAQLLHMLEKISGTAEAEIALGLLEKTAEGAALLKDAFASEKALGLIELLASVPTSSARTRLSQMVQSSRQEIRVAAVRALARTQAGAENLLQLARKKQFPAALVETASEALALVQFNDRENKLKHELQEHFPAPARNATSPLPAIAELVKKHGDANRGQAVFAKLESSCITCHKIGNIGADFGPNLSEIGTKLGRDALYESIINPNNGISMGFETQLFKTQNGNASVGILRSETDQEITVALPGGSVQRIPKKEVKSREKLPHSMMPAGLGQMLGEQNLVDLVEYLTTCRAK